MIRRHPRRLVVPTTVAVLALASACAGPRGAQPARDPAVYAMATRSPQAQSDQPAGPASAGAPPATAPTDATAEKAVVTRHTLTTSDGQTLRYTATAGTILLRDPKDAATAEVFYVSFIADGQDPKQPRPVTFAFNGGPGSSAVWLQLGILGPRRVDFVDAVAPPPPPYRVVDQPGSLLATTDLVFIDPIGTGFSRPIGDAKPESFQGLTQDVRAVAEFIRLWVAKSGRWNAAKFLAGESYGTTRASALVNALQDDGMVFNGVILVSSILDFSTARFEPGNDLPYVLYLPTYAAIAVYHGAIPAPTAGLPAFLAEVRRFALEDYQQALAQGAALAPERRAKIRGQLAAYTGLSEAYIESSDLRVPIHRFTKELKRSQGQTVGRLDARYLGYDADSAGESPSSDPSYSAIMGPYTAAMNHYLRHELEYVDDHRYEILSIAVNQRWDWDQPGRAGYVNVAEDLARAMRSNPHLHVFIANGYYDLATPFFATEYTVDHLRIPAALRSQIELSYYDAGHMMYLHADSLRGLSESLTSFCRRAANLGDAPAPKRRRSKAAAATTPAADSRKTP